MKKFEYDWNAVTGKYRNDTIHVEMCGDTAGNAR